MLSSNWTLVTLAAGGLSVASIETYKTLITAACAGAALMDLVSMTWRVSRSRQRHHVG